MNLNLSPDLEAKNGGLEFASDDGTRISIFTEF